MDEVFGRYRLRGLLGEGGMGQVFRAYDTELHREVAIKVLPPQVSVDRSFEQRFRREARAAAGLGEPHVVPIHDSGEIDGRLFIAMQLIAGTDLGTLLGRDGPLTAERAVSVIEQAAAALNAAHDAGLVHRDVKPANLLITPKDFVYLIDFGIARAAGETQLTGTGSAIGTLAYMAPERFTKGQIDHRADIYALACVLHQCLTGQTPYPTISAEQQMFAHVNGPPPRPSQIQPDVTAAFDDVVAHGMAASPDQRYQSAGELATAARAALHSFPAPPRPVAAYAAQAPTQPAPTMQRTSAPPGKRSRRWIAVLAAATVVIAATATGIWLWANDEHHDQVNAVPTISAKTPRTVTATIKTGRSPGAVAVDPTRHAVYVSDERDNVVSVIDTATNSVTEVVKVGEMPAAIAIDQARHTAYIVNFGIGTLKVFDTSTNTVTATINIKKALMKVAVDPSTHTVYVTNVLHLQENSVSVVDSANNTVTAAIDVGKGPEGVAIDPSKRTAYVANSDDHTVSVIDTVTNTVTASINVGRMPEEVALDPAARTAYVTNASDDTVSVIDTSTNTVSATIKVGNMPEEVALDPAARTAYVTNAQENTVSVIDTVTNTVTATINVGKMPWGMAVDPTTHVAYVANHEDGTVSIIEPAR